MFANICVRFPIAEDAGDMGRTHVAAWQAGYRGLMTDAVLDGLDPMQRVRYWRRLLSDGPRLDPAVGPIPVVADVDGNVVGIAAYGPYRFTVADRVGDESSQALPAGELWMLNVDPAYWGAGVAQALDAHVIGQLKLAFPGQTAALWVLGGNARGRRFYEKQGWRADGQSKTDDVARSALTEVRYGIDL